MGLVKIALPITVLLIFEWFLENKYLKFSDIRGNIYGNKMLVLIFFATLSSLWGVNDENTTFQLFYLLYLVINSYLIYHFIKKHKLYRLLIFSVLFYSIVTYTLILNLPFFQVLAFNGEGSTTIINGWSSQGRYSGMNDNPNTLAIYMIFSIFISFISFDYFNFRKSLRILFSLNVLCAIAVIFFTQSKKGLIFGFLFILLYLLLNFSIRKFSYIFLISILALIVLAQIPVIEEAFQKSLYRFEVMLSVLEGRNVVGGGSTDSRLDFIKLGWEGFKEKPLFGHGINSFQHYYGHVSHNNFIELLFSFGIIGPLIYYQIHISILLKLFLNRIGLNVGILIFILILMDMSLLSFESKVVMFVIVSCLLLSKEIINEKSNIINGEKL